MVAEAEIEVREDSGVVNFSTKMGTRDDWQTHTRPGEITRLSKREVEYLSTIPILNRICTAYPEAAILNGWEVTLGKEGVAELKDKINEKAETLEIADAFNEAQFQANVYGGAAIVMLIDDNQPANAPINEKKIKDISGFIVLDRYKIRPVFEGIENPKLVKKYQITLPQFLSEDLKRFNTERFGQGYYVDASRVIPFHGSRVTPDVMRDNEGWGISLLEQLWDDYKGYATTLTSSTALLKDFSLFVAEIEGLMDLMRSQDEDDQRVLQKMLKLFHESATLFGGVFVDKERQKIDFPSRNLTGVDRISINQREAFIGSSGMPHTHIFGESPSGLGATGESEERNWAQEVGKFQKSKWHKKLRKVYRLLLLAKNGPTKGQIPKGWNLKYHSLIQLSVEEEIQNGSTQAQTDMTYIDRGVLTPEEVRTSRFGGAVYSHETTLDEEAYQKYQQENNPDQGGDEYDPFGDFGFGESDQDLEKTDSAEKIKRIIQLQGLSIAIEHEVGETRFKGAKPLSCAYGHIRGSYGDGLDGMSLDVYVGSNFDNPEIYRIRQLIPETGEVDEDKYFLAMKSLEAARKAFLATAGRSRFGGIEIVGQELDKYRAYIKQDAEPPDSTMALTNKAIIDGTPIINEWVDGIQQWMADKGSFEDVQQGRAELYDLLEGDRFTQLIEETNTIADLTGREVGIDETEAEAEE